MRAAVAEIGAALLALQQAFEELIVRGLESTGPDDVRRLEAIGEEFSRAGASYVAGQVSALVRCVRESGDGAARALLRAQTACRVFERVMSLEVAAEILADGAALEPRSSEGLPERSPARGEAERSGQGFGAARPDTIVLEELAGFVEGLVASGMTTASPATRQRIDASFKEASRLKLLRLATSLRYVGDELGRFLDDSERFSPRRLAFFLNRTWLISRGLIEAIAEDDRDHLARLLLSTSPQPVKKLVLATVGVQKRALVDGSAAFDFRFVALDGDGPVARGTRLVWSCVFGARRAVPAEAFLHLPQPQKFTPKILLDAVRIAVTDAAVALDDTGGGRLMLGPKSTVTAGKAVDDWELARWDRQRAIDRIRRHRISPLDLEVEMQEEIVVDEWELGAPAASEHRPDQKVFPLRWGTIELDAAVSTGPDGTELTRALEAFRKPRAVRPPLYGLMHYEMGRLLFQPLSALTEDGPQHLMISSENIDLAALMKTLDFKN